MKSRLLATVMLATLVGACSATPAVVPTRNLDRPSDMGFVCLAVDPSGELLSGSPMSKCHPPGEKDPPIQPTGSSPRQLGTFILLTNTARNELAAVDLDNNRLIDLDPAVFGFNMVPVGSMPESMATSADGCWVVTANRDSCDLGLVDPSRLLVSLFQLNGGTVTPATGPGSPISRVLPHTASGRLLNSSPKEINFLSPSQTPGLCDASKSPLALVTFPSCDLVALLNMPSGEIVDSVYIRPDRVVSAGNEPICPADCPVEGESQDAGGTQDDAGQPVAPADDDGGQVVAPAAGDGGAGDGQASVPSHLGVGAMALLADSSRVYVGASAADDFLIALDIVDGALVIPADGGRIALERGAIGVDHMRLSDPPITLPDGTVEGRGQFLYAFARDSSVRVVNVGVRPEQECDVNSRPDLAGLPANTACFPVNPKARQPLAQGPGIRIPTLPVRTAAPAIARDIAVVDLPVTPAGIQKNPQALAGRFAFLVASNDAVYILNLDPTNEPNTPTHSFREVRATNQYTADMLVLSSTPPLRTTVPSDLLFPSTPILSSLSGPRLERVTDTAPPAVPISTNTTTTEYWADFPYQNTFVSRALSIAWEDVLPGTVRSSGILADPAASTPAGALDDAGADFCAKGVLAGDLVVLPGCLADTDCDPQDTFSCRQPVSGATGLCLPKTADQNTLDTCARFSGSRRRYEILTATPSSLTLGLHLDEVPKTALNRVSSQESGSDREAECQPTDAHKPSGSRLGFSWQQVRPNETFKRCVEPCGSSPASSVARPPSAFDRDCRPGFVCEAVPGSLPAVVPGPNPPPAGYCVEAPPLDRTCWPQPANRYHVNVGTSFFISGTSLPDLQTNRVVDGQCQLDPEDPVLANRIPMSAPLCATIDGVVPIQNVTELRTSTSDPTEVALFGQAAPPVAEAGIPATPNAPYAPVTPPSPNPCLYEDFNYDDLTAPSPGTGVGTAGGADGGAGNGLAGKSIKAIFQDPQFRFVLTNLDQYGGDSLVTRLNLTGGFVPATVAVTFDVALTQPIRIFTGPSKLPDSPLVTDLTSTISYPYVFILDQGRTALTPNSRGQIVRLNARKGDSALTTLDPAEGGTTPFQIQ